LTNTLFNRQPDGGNNFLLSDMFQQYFGGFSLCWSELSRLIAPARAVGLQGLPR